MGNVVLAVQILGSLITQALQVQQAIGAAQASGTDITDAQLATLTASATMDLSKLVSDIAAAKAAGK